ncbi:MAG: tubulin-like doman-containing protein [Nitritalea sp.]
MAKQLRRTLYIGLGGTGLQAILETKRRLLETYLEIPPMIGFLAVDTDANAANKTLPTKFEKVPDATLDKSEFCSLVVNNPRAIFDQQQNLFSWMPPENAQAMVAIQFGAGQVRTTGRFAAICNYNALETVISNKISQIASAEHINNNNYRLANDTLEIHMVFSLGGGTGSGTFIDVGYILKHIVNTKFSLKTKTFGYAVLPDVFAQMDPGGTSMQRVRPNGFGALMDLDFLMHLNPTSEPITIDYGNGTPLRFKESPFESVTLINNSNQSGHIYTRVNDLAELISLGLTIGGSDLGAGVQSVMDNVVTMVASGSLDVENKKAWANGMGICEINIDGNRLANLYAEKVIEKLILNLENVSGDSSSTVNAWIDSPEVMIRENNGRDDLINKILDANPRVPLLDIDDVKNPEPYLNQFIESAKVSPEELHKTTVSLLNTSTTQLKELFKKELNKPCGLGNSLQIAQELLVSFNTFKKDMQEEREEFKTRIANLEAQMKVAAQELVEVASKFSFRKKAAVDECKQALISITNELAKSHREVSRREYAIIFYTDLSQKAREFTEKLEHLREQLSSLSEQSKVKSNSLTNSINLNSKTFVIELQSRYAATVTPSDSDASVENFIQSLDGNKLFDFMGMNEELMRTRLWDYSAKLTGTRKWRNISINEVLQDLPKEQLDQIIQQSIQKSMPLFAYDFKGIVINKNLHQSFFVGLPESTGASLLEKDSYFKSFLPANTNVNFTSTGIQDRIIIYRQLVAVPVYAVVGVSGYEAIYKQEKGRKNFHIDKNWENRMIQENFSIHPGTDESNALELWVKGLLHGFIENKAGSYRLKSRLLGKALADHWHTLDASGFRDDAFHVFTKQLPQFESELQENIREKEQKEGNREVKQRLQSMTAEAYLATYSQVGISAEELTREEKKFGGVMDLLEKELNYIHTELVG